MNHDALIATSRRDKRLADAARRLLAHIGEILQADLSVRLWTGEILPLGTITPGSPVLAVRSPGAVARLVRRPRLTTLIELVAAGELEIERGTLLDVARRRGSISSKGLLRRLDKRLVAASLWPFLFTPGTAGGDHAFQGPIADREAAGRDNAALIQFHYDLSNAFYALFLDPEMQYSCAYFPRWDASLEEAQLAKLDMICRKLRLAPGERLLDIGCGWGGLVCHAARRYGVIAHGITLSQAQLAFAKEKVAELGLRDRVTVELRDYRDIDGTFDKIASIGMFEHVGLDNHNAYFAKMHALLRPRGLLLNHAIARRAKRDMRRFRRKRSEYAALTRYVFPGGELDYIGLSLTNLERHGFEIHDVEGWREHYARTCALWCERLAANREAAEREVGAARTRLWLLYLAGCALTFERGGAGIFQTLASKRGIDASGLPPTRADLYR
ncbi:MAG TPA: cyclopropane-fatty-acyl-phospholipid synthase family protein [Alphaproteobacteria bacterium]|nr:cyclopropane-fatty-acyl-phospholipid synthase family protein [Alphaproteobacteria bacterium]